MVYLLTDEHGPQSLSKEIEDLYFVYEQGLENWLRLDTRWSKIYLHVGYEATSLSAELDSRR